MTMEFGWFVILLSSTIVGSVLSQQQTSNPFIQPSSDEKSAQLLSHLPIPILGPANVLGGSSLLPEDSVPAVGARQQLLREGVKK